MDWKERKTYLLLGETVTVQVDRPIGYCHGDIVYPINYGFVPGVLGGDGEEQDAYILGVDHPVAQFTGTVVGVIRRHNDCEDKLVVAPAGMEFHQGEIAAAVRFQEQYFISTIDCLKRKSCGVIPYRDAKEGPEILVVFEAFSQCWSLPKGHMEAEETEAETALRELWEETGLCADLDMQDRIVTEYPTGPKSRKEVVLFPGKVKGNPAARPGEIEECRWVAATRLSDYLFPDTCALVEQWLRKRKGKQAVEVVAALIWEDNRFMICQRPAHKARGLLWEFVGGKTEPGETLQQALVRECREELDVTVSVGDVFMDVVHSYPDITVHLTLFHATIPEGKPKKLEHNDIRWITPAQISEFDFCPADTEILQKIQETYA